MCVADIYCGSVCGCDRVVVLMMSVYVMQNPQRGKGLVLKITSPIHINISIAMIRALNDAMRVVKDIDDKRREVRGDC